MRRALLLALAVVLPAAPARAEPPEQALRVDIASSYSSLSHNLPPWRETSAVLTYRPDASVWISGGIEHSVRFGLEDDVASLRLVRTLRRGAAVWADLALSPGADFRAISSIHAGATFAPMLELPGEWQLAPGIEGVVSRYRIGDVQSLQPSIALSNARGVSLSTRLIETWDESRHRLTGYALRAGAPIGNRAQIGLGYADAPESDAGKTIKTKAVSGWASFDLDASTSLRVTATRETRSSFNRNEIALGLARRF